MRMISHDLEHTFPCSPNQSCRPEFDQERSPKHTQHNTNIWPAALGRRRQRCRQTTSQTFDYYSGSSHRCSGFLTYTHITKLIRMVINICAQRVSLAKLSWSCSAQISTILAQLCEKAACVLRHTKHVIMKPYAASHSSNACVNALLYANYRAKTYRAFKVSRLMCVDNSPVSLKLMWRLRSALMGIVIGARKRA